MKKIYFAQAVDLLTANEVKTNTDYAMRRFLENGYEVCNSFEPFTEIDNTDALKELVETQIERIKQSDIFVGDFSKSNYPYIGCVGEVIYAHINKKKVYIITGKSGNENRVWLKYHATKIFYTMDELITYLNVQGDN